LFEVTAESAPAPSEANCTESAIVALSLGAGSIALFPKPDCHDGTGRNARTRLLILVEQQVPKSGATT
jgi:hypothetical protein